MSYNTTIIIISSLSIIISILMIIINKSNIDSERIRHIKRKRKLNGLQ